MGMDSAAIMTFVSLAIVSEISKVWKSQKNFWMNVEVVVWEILKLMYSLFSKLAHFGELKKIICSKKRANFARISPWCDPTFTPTTLC